MHSALKHDGGRTFMKKLIVLFVALAVATGAFAADFSFSWDTDFGWASNFDDDWNGAFDELELAVAADIDDYNSFAMEMEPDSAMAMQFNSFAITTDLGAYLGLSGIGLSWANGYKDLGGDAEYSDFGIVGHNNAGTDKANLSKSWTTSLKLTSGAMWLQAASNWNLGVDSNDDVSLPAANAPARQMQFYAGAADVIPGLSLEAGVRMDMDDVAASTAGNVIAFDAAYSTDMDAMALTVGGSFATSDKDYTAPADAWEQVYGAGAKVGYTVDDMTGVYASVSFLGNDVEAFQALGGGAGVTYGDLGAEVAFDYNTTIDAGDAALAGVDIKGFVNIGAVCYTVGYVVTDYGWDNSSRGDLPTEGGLYMKLTADF